jgi:hypothetical protein
MFLKSLNQLPAAHVLGPNPLNIKNLIAIAYQCIYFPLHLQSNHNTMDMKPIAAMQIRGHELLACIFNCQYLNATPDLTFLCAIKISMDVFFLLISQSAHNSFSLSSATGALPAPDQHSFVQALVKSLTIAKANFGKIPESHPKFFYALPEVAATLARTSTAISDTSFLQLAGSLTNFCLQHLLNTTAGIEKKHVSICCKSFFKLLGTSMSSDSYGVRGCSLLLMQIVLRTCSQSGPSAASSLSILQNAISGLHHVLLAEDIVMTAYKEGSWLMELVLLPFLLTSDISGKITICHRCYFQRRSCQVFNMHSLQRRSSSLQHPRTGGC